MTRVRLGIDARPIAPFEFWTGASGNAYVHSVYSLLECPDLQQATYLLAARFKDGSRDILDIGRLEHQAPSLNLAKLRLTGTRLGANEVHVHMLAGSAEARRVVELDLRARHLGTLSNRSYGAA